MASSVTQSAKQDKPPSAGRLLAWYDKNRRDLPWRARPGETPDPYHVWLSEIMLQQTTVAAVGPYYRAFLARWPSVAALAKAPAEEVMAAWAGLGYYSRARNLHECARRILADHGGVFPNEPDALRALPGLGPYTVAAMRAIAFNLRANVVDGNVERVMARIFAVKIPLPAAKKELTALAESLLPRGRYGDYAQALMDLGATVCTPKSPDCGRCPWALRCAGRKLGIAAELPARTAKAPKPQRLAHVFLAVRESDGAVFLRRRADKGLFGGMMEIPFAPAQEARPPFPARWRPKEPPVHHTFTHFDLECRIFRANIRDGAQVPAQTQGRFVPPSAWASQALPSLMRKILGAHAGPPKRKGKTS